MSDHDVTLTAIEQRAARLTKLRNMANLTRESICDGDNIKFHTYKAWELSRQGGLTEKGAKKVVERVAKESVLCTVEWLMHGSSPQPLVVMANDYQGIDDLCIASELTVFSAYNNQNILYSTLTDDVPPLFQIGDVAAGVKIEGDLSALVGNICLLEDNTHQVFIGKLIRTLEHNTFLINTLNTDTTIERTLLSAARIIRHYKMR